MVYTAPAVAPAAPGRCDLVITLTSQYGATIWSGLIAWVNPTVTGLWSGPATDAVRGAFTATFDISQAGDTVAGTYTTDFGGTGTFSGTTDGTVIAFTVEVLNPGCHGFLTGTAEVNPAANQMTMSYAGTTVCMGDTTGSGVLSKGGGVPRVAFVTSTTYAADFGGTAGADFLCQQRANAGIQALTLPVGAYKAILSASGSSAVDRIADGRFVLPDGTLVANDKLDLFDSTIQHAIDMNEFGVPVFQETVWTGSWEDGNASLDCNGFTSTAPDVYGVAGIARLDLPWVSWIRGGFYPCDGSYALYCVQQSSLIQ